MKRRSRSSLALVPLACLLAVAGCGTSPGDGRPPSAATRTPSPADTRRPADPVTTPTAKTPVPRGKGSERADDVNGDGYADLVHWNSDESGGTAGLTVVHGSAKGLDPATYTRIEKGDIAGMPDWFPPTMHRADLDGDGFGDVVSAGHWLRGSPDGLRAEAALTLTDAHGTPVTTGVPGDFDADGKADLAVTAGAGTVRILYGPFAPDTGRPARSGQPLRLATEYGFAAIGAGQAGGGEGDDLVLHDSNDGEQSGASLLRSGAGPGGFAGPPKKLRVGNAHAFGDFDGDGRGDLAVGDDGSRNNEPGYETEAPEVDRKITVYFGAADKAPKTLTADTAGPYLAGDVDGDGDDDLVLRTAGAYGNSATVLNGGPDGPSSDDPAVLQRVGGSPAKDAYLRGATVHSVQDFDGDGRDEVVLFRPERGKGAVHWWVVDARTGKDVVAFTDAEFTEK
ncbi:FG-GAP repeat domain-containing protein [Streptomyces sp. NPDC050418]|uniref:FG-GAP repeat domain-containing protein n=1 Tax=Streptomyces sp. NPDC050418 TaxID=3365612 RepID=UPI0037B3F99D